MMVDMNMNLHEFHHSCGIFFGHLDLKVRGYHVDSNSRGKSLYNIVMKSVSANVVFVRFVEFHCEY